VSVVEDMQADIGTLPLSAFDAQPADGTATAGASP
jgi:hypothetical protein